MRKPSAKPQEAAFRLIRSRVRRYEDENYRNRIAEMLLQRSTYGARLMALIMWRDLWRAVRLTFRSP